MENKPTLHFYLMAKNGVTPEGFDGVEIDSEWPAGFSPESLLIALKYPDGKAVVSDKIRVSVGTVESLIKAQKPNAH